jgi:hypothetical protein
LIGDRLEKRKKEKEKGEVGEGCCGARGWAGLLGRGVGCWADLSPFGPDFFFFSIFSFSASCFFHNFCI